MSLAGSADHADHADGDRTGSEFARQVRDALRRLYDPVYLQTHPLTRLLPRQPEARTPLAGVALRQCLLDAIAALQPPVGTGLGAAQARRHQLLTLRYEEALEIAAVEERLAVSRREYHREHHAALASLTLLLRDRLPGPVGQGSEVVAPGAAEAAARSAAQIGDRAPAARLPLPLTSFIGRERECAEVARLLASARLLTLIGPPGTGKTRLAIRVAADLTSGFADGVAFVPLATVSDCDLVLPTVARAFGLPEAGGISPLTALTEYLQGKQLLLVLDNFEQVVGAAPSIAELLAVCARLTALVTSRVKLNVYGEQEFAVPPLALPGLKLLPTKEQRTQLLRFESVRLFEERAQAVKADFTLTDESAITVAAICRRLDGLPLAIELAAARGKLLSPQALLTRLEQRLPVLTGGPRDLPARQQTLRGAIDWSHDLLTPGERTLLRRLAIFVGGCTLEAASEVGGEPDHRGESSPSRIAATLDGLAALIDHSLLLQEEAGDGEPRFRMLETVREYAGEQLQASGEEHDLRRRHAAHYLSLALRAEPKLTSGQRDGWLAQLDADHDNLRAALRWHEQHAPGDAVSMAAALCWFWILRGHLSEGRPSLRRALAGSEVMSKDRAQALYGAAHLAFCQGDLAAGRALSQQSIALWRSLGDKRGLGYALQVLCLTAGQHGDGELAREAHRESVSLLRQVGDDWGLAHVMAPRVLAFVLGNHAAARTEHAESVTIFRRLGDDWGLGIALGSLGYVAFLQGDDTTARTLSEESLAMRRAAQDRFFIIAQLVGLGSVALRQGDERRAVAAYAEALRLCRELGDQHAVLAGIEGIAAIAAGRGQAADAARLFSAVDALHLSAGGTWWQDGPVDAQQRLASTRAALGEVAFTVAWTEGQRMSRDEAIGLALAVVGDA